jgi:hypothetical protein
MEYRYGEKVTIVANPRNVKNAAFRRFKKGEPAQYMVHWVGYDRTRIEAAYIGKNGNTSASYIFRPDEILPTKLVGKQLEDYM